MSSPIPRAHWSHFLLPGLHIKRWLLLLMIGVTLAGLGLAFLIRQWYVTDQLPAPAYSLAMRALPDWIRGLLLLSRWLAHSDPRRLVSQPFDGCRAYAGPNAAGQYGDGQCLA